MKLSKLQWIMLIVAVVALGVGIFSLKLINGQTIFEWIQENWFGKQPEEAD